MADPLLTLVQWLSPAFPVGGFAYSHGLEWAIAAGELRDAPTLAPWIEETLRFGAGRNDAILIAQCLAEGADIPALAALAQALAASRERLVESMEQGRAFLAVTNRLTGDDWPPMPYPVALGAAARALGLAPVTVVSLYLHAFASNLVQAGVRFIPLGQTEGQKVLAGLHPCISALADEAAAASIDDLGGGAMRGDLAAMRHETMEVRIFRT